MQPAGLSAGEYLAWCELLGRPAVDLVTLNPMDRAAALPAWAVPPLIATEAARQRLREWSAAGSIVPTPDDLVRKLKFLGDAEIRSVVLRALDERVPPPAAAYLLDSVLFVGLAWSAAGYAIRTAMPPGSLLSLVILSAPARDPDALLNLTLHETAHSWLLPDPAQPLAVDAMSNEQGALLLAAASRPDLMQQIVLAQATAEGQADDLAQHWGARHGCGEHATNYTVREAARLHALHGRGGRP